MGWQDWFGGGSVATKGTQPFGAAAETSVVSSEFSYGNSNRYNGSNGDIYNGNGYNGNGGGAVYGLFGNDNNRGNGGGYGSSPYEVNGGAIGYGGSNNYGASSDGYTQRGERASDAGGYDQRPGGGSSNGYGYGDRGTGERTGWD